MITFLLVMKGIIIAYCHLVADAKNVTHVPCPCVTYVPCPCVTYVPWLYKANTLRSRMLVPLGVAATKWGICVHKVGYLCTQSGVFVVATLRGDALTLPV